MLPFLSVICAFAFPPALAGDALEIPFTAANYAVGGVAQGLAVGDFTSDGILDVAVVRASPGGVTLFVGNGDGSLTEGASTAAGVRPLAVVSGDVDGNGTLDLVVINNGSHDASVLGGAGDGTFALIARPVLGPFPRHAALGHLDDDAHLDLVATTDLGQVLILSNDGAGDFALEESFQVDESAHNAVIASLNPEVDARLDVLVAEGLGGLTLHTNQGDYAFTQSALPMSFGGFANWVTVGDTDLDGDLDVIAIEWDGIDTDPILIHSQGDGGFALQGYLDFDEQANRRVLLADFNGDAYPDSLTLNTRFQNPDVIDYFTIFAGELQAQPFGDPQPAELEIVLPTGTAEVLAADLTGDGFDEILSTNASTGQLTVRVNDSCPGFPLLQSVLPRQVPALAPAPVQVAVGGCGLTAATAVRVDGVRVDAFAAPTTLELSFDMPLVDQLGAVDIELDSPQGTRTIAVEVTAPAPLVVLGDGGELSNSAGAASLTMGAAPGDVFLLLASPSAVPSVLPGVLEADIGNGFQTLFFVTTPVIGAQAWAPFAFGFSALPVGLEIHFQGAVLEAAAPVFPLVMTDVVTASVVP